MNKPEILKLLRERDLVPAEALILAENPVKAIDPKYEFTKSIRTNPKSVCIIDHETGIETEYPSIYKASHMLGCSTTVITKNHSKRWKGRYWIYVRDN